MTTLPVEVIRKRLQAHSIASFELARPDAAPLPTFEPGAHIDVHLPGGLVRQYSLCDAGATHGYRIAVLRDAGSRGGSRAMHDAVAVGDRLQISAPRNHFALAPARRSLLLAGGIGITPLLCMAQALSAAGADFALHYCARSPAHAAFRDEIDASTWARRVQWHFDDGPPDRRLDAAALLARPEPGVHVYVCGPRGFMDHVTATARAHGWPDAQVHFEHFGAPPAALPGADQPFAVRLARSGRSIEVPPHLTVVQALQAQGVDIPVSCEQGVCGTCLTPVLEGRCDHRDLFLTDAEKLRNDQFTPCCSRALGPLLVLDL